MVAAQRNYCVFNNINLGGSIVLKTLTKMNANIIKLLLASSLLALAGCPQSSDNDPAAGWLSHSYRTCNHQCNDAFSE